MPDRESVRIGAAVSYSAKVHQECIVKLVREARITRRTPGEPGCTARNLVRNHAGRQCFRAFVAGQQDQRENQVELLNCAKVKHVVSSRSQTGSFFSMAAAERTAGGIQMSLRRRVQFCLTRRPACHQHDAICSCAERQTTYASVVRQRAERSSRDQPFFLSVSKFPVICNFAESDEEPNRRAVGTEKRKHRQRLQERQ